MTSLIALSLFAAVPDAGVSVTLALEGRNGRVELSLKDLQALGAVTIDWADKTGAHKVTGVRLDKLFAKLGYDEGPTGPQAPSKDKHRGVRGVIVASAPDGFEAVFSVAELQEALGPTTAVVAWEMDGKPLPANMGPLRIFVPTDKKPTRAIYQLNGLKLVEAGTARAN